MTNKLAESLSISQKLAMELLQESEPSSLEYNIALAALKRLSQILKDIKFETDMYKMNEGEDS